MDHEKFSLAGRATAIGSMPHTDPAQACSQLLSNLADIPVWPQLPHRSFLENMYAQYSEGLPGLIIDSERIYVDLSADLSGPMELLYDAYINADYDRFKITPEYAAGLHYFLSQKLNSPLAVKGQVTGPISFGLMVTDQNRRPILYDETFADAITKHLRLKAAWQQKELAKLSPNTIMFIDEPYLASMGSAFVAVSNDMVVKLINEVLEGIDGLTGIHCCGNTDWSVLMSSSIDILNFDAYNFGESLALYPTELKNFIERGGSIAYGIIPNEEDLLNRETIDSIITRLDALLNLLSSKGISYDILVDRCLITPCCGLASMSTQAAERALKLTSNVSREFRRIKHLSQ